MVAWHIQNANAAAADCTWAHVLLVRAWWLMPAHATRLRLPLQVSKLLVYSPTQRSTALEAMRHPFFNELRDPACRLPNGAVELQLPQPTGWALCGVASKWCLPLQLRCWAAAWPALKRMHSRRAAGRPLPPLFNWLPNELAQASPELYASLQPRAPGAAAGAPL